MSEDASYTDVLSDKPPELIGRNRELELITAVLLAGEHILLEGAPGTSKSTLLRYVTSKLKIPFFQVEGSADLTPSKLIGTFNPNLVLEQGFKSEFFEPGPLFQAMNEGGILYIEELNRAAPDATNALIRAMEEGEIIIPRYGTVSALSTFRLVTAMNPFDDTGVTRISRALFDRLCRIKMDYQELEEEIKIVGSQLKTAPNSLIEIGARIARATRYDDRLRQGSSVRGAIDFTKIVEKLGMLRKGYSTDTILDAALAAFTSKIWLENPNHKEEDIVLENVETILRNLDQSFFDDLNLELKKKDDEDLMQQLLDELSELARI
ncbi:MAG: AAA family ATPase, partial [Candidatus Kariarchaeaceae archaeon]